MNVLIACEESQTVMKEFRKLGHNAYSNDIQQCSGGDPEYHLQIDVFEVLKGGELITQAGSKVFIDKWDLMIAHPPCTYISYVGNRWFNIDRYGEKAIERHKNKDLAIEFFMQLWNCDIPKICLENPRGFIQKILKPNQIIQPYFFGDTCSKTTLLWLKNLPPLYHNKIENLFDTNVTHVDKGEMDIHGSGSEYLWGIKAFNLPAKERAALRSKTFPGIARAMAYQWGC